MFNIPDSLKDKNENYLVVPVLKKFCYSNSLGIHNIREDLISEIYAFANTNEVNKEVTLSWLDDCFKEGIKHLFIRKIFSSNNNLEPLKNKINCIKVLNDTFQNCPKSYIASSKNIHELKLQNYNLVCDEDNEVIRICFNFTILLLEGNNLSQNGNRFIYPIFVDLDLANGYLIGRAKSKSNMFYKKDKNDDIIYENYKTNVQDLIIKSMDKIALDLDIQYFPNDYSSSDFKNKLYNILKRYTFTPDEIESKIVTVTDKIDYFIDDIFKDIDVPIINNFQNAKEDLNIFVEKYISINYEDQSIFTKDREAFPIKLSSTDSESTKIEETSADKEPLQHREKFFDNKKSIEKEQTCDGMTLCFKRLNKRYFGNNPYTVRIDIRKGYCIIKLFQYTEEEDIKNVLSRIVNDSE